MAAESPLFFKIPKEDEFYSVAQNENHFAVCNKNPDPEQRKKFADLFKRNPVTLAGFWSMVCFTCLVRAVTPFWFAHAWLLPSDFFIVYHKF